MIDIAIVGTGYIGRLHANVIKQSFKNARVAAVVEAVEKKGREFADQIGAAYYSDFDDMLEKADVEVVAICTPTYQHAGMVKKAAVKKKHIFCEKPLAISVDEAEEMIETVERQRVKAVAGHVLRFWPVYVRARQIINSGVLGRPLYGYCERFLTIPRYTEAAWNASEKLGGGVALDVHIHDLDYLIWVMGMPDEIRSQGIYDESMGGWMHIGTQLSYPGNGKASVQAGWNFPESFPFTMGFRFVCESGALEWSFRAGKLLEQREAESPIIVYRSDGSLQKEPVEKSDAFFLEWKYFLDCLERDEEVRNATFHDGKNALRLALDAMKSAKTGKVISYS